MKPDGVSSGVPEVYSNALAWFQHGLLAHHAFTLDIAEGAAGAHP